MAQDERLDIAILVTDYEFPVFDMASRGEYNSMRMGDKVISAGFPLSIKPGVVTIGHVISTSYMIDGVKGLQHTSGIWFGNSGGMLIDYRSGKVLGINATIHVGQNGYPRSDTGWAVPAYLVWRVYASIGK